MNDRPMVERMAVAFAEAETRDATDLEGNQITWGSLGVLRQRHLISCMRDVLWAMKDPPEEMIKYCGSRAFADYRHLWNGMIEMSATVMAADRLDDGEVERAKKRIEDILREP